MRVFGPIIIIGILIQRRYTVMSETKRDDQCSGSSNCRVFSTYPVWFSAWIRMFLIEVLNFSPPFTAEFDSNTSTKVIASFCDCNSRLWYSYLYLIFYNFRCDTERQNVLLWMEASFTLPLVSFWLYILYYCSFRTTHRYVFTFPKKAVAVLLTDMFPAHWWPDVNKSKSSRTKFLTKYLLHVVHLLSVVVRRNELMQWAERHPNYTVVPVCVKV
jgi:hypothetical protein